MQGATSSIYTAGKYRRPQSIHGGCEISGKDILFYDVHPQVGYPTHVCNVHQVESRCCCTNAYVRTRNLKALCGNEGGLAAQRGRGGESSGGG